MPVTDKSQLPKFPLNVTMPPNGFASPAEPSAMFTTSVSEEMRNEMGVANTSGTIKHATKKNRRP